MMTEKIMNNMAGSGCGRHLPTRIEVNMKKTKFFNWKYMN
jgi:hypothetical protein